MKKNDWLLLISVLFYSLLFYKQTSGLNFLLFNSVIVAGLASRDQSLIKNKIWISVAAGAMISSFFIFMYGSALAIIANITSLAILSVISISPAVSFLTSIFVSACAIGSSCVVMFLDMVKRRKNKIVQGYKRSALTKLLLIAIPLMITIVFFLMYQSSNPLFYNFTKDINLDFISFQWIFFTFGGLLLMYGLFNNSRLNYFVKADENTPLDLTPHIAENSGWFRNMMRIDTENLSGIILFVLLNLLLLILNLLDLNHLCFNGGLPEGVTHKAFVHDAIGTLILSIIFAIIIILFYFRGRLNYYENNRSVKILAYTWIIQNVFMVLSAAYRNHLYISESGLSYKKIGVYVYLLLCIIGLVITFVKLYKLKTNWYMFRTNASAAYYLLILFCIPNWDVIITDYNINKCLKQDKKLEKYFLADLSFKNIPQLLALPEDLASTNDYHARDYYFSSRNVYFRDFNSALDQKLYRFLDEYQKADWQSYCVEKERVFTEVMAMKKDIREMDLSSSGMRTLQPIFLLSDIKDLSFSNNFYDSLEELSSFPQLEKLDISNNYIKSISGFPFNSKLKELDISHNSIIDFERLTQCPSLISLSLSANNVVNVSSVPKLEKLRTLDLSSNSIRSFKDLDKFPALEELRLSAAIAENHDTFPQLKNLKTLDISSNQLNYAGSVFFQNIAQYSTLYRLNVSGNPLRALSFLVTGGAESKQVVPVYPELTNLDASQCVLSSIYPLYLYPSLELLNLSGNSISNVDVLKSISALRELNLSNNKIGNTEALKSLLKLEVLNLSSNLLASGADLSTLTSLKELNISNNEFSDISFLKNLRSLRVLNLSGNDIENPEVLLGLEQLEELTITIWHETDKTFLYKMKNLKVLNISNFSSKDIVLLSKALPELTINLLN
ncbi:MAG: hypothetical protein K0S44_1241 [Bacteroidetes bacterium]|jgi:hypothetical protein|nr:hypothetical protein [Bacteroidota bacterium]